VPPHAIESIPPRPQPVNGRRAYRWLALLPALGICVGAPLVDRLHATVAGFPLLLVWIVGCVLLTSAVMALISALDDRTPPS
jgi:uncharacterized protein DUF3311